MRSRTSSAASPTPDCPRGLASASVRSAAVQQQAEGTSRRVDALRRPPVAALVVLALYAGLALLNSTGGYLGTDTGAKVATLDAMVEAGTLSPDVGYWAAAWDPDGTYHPLMDTARNDDGEWINVTTLPMLVAAWPLYAAGGYRLALLLPMIGAVLTAFACRDVARQIGDESDGWRAFWITALASPLAIYALDLWEHSLGAALMVGAFAALLRVFRGTWRWSLPAAAGAALGTSAAMRTETFVVAFVFVGATCAALAWRRQIGRAVACGSLAVGGFAVPWSLNGLLEAALGGNSRADRAAGVAGGAWWSELGTRVEEAAITWFGLPGASFPGGVLLGIAAVAGIVLMAFLLRRGDRRPAALAIAAAAVAYGAGLSGGFAFVPGALVTAPVAALVVLVRDWDAARRFVLANALVATVLIWLFQFTGGAAPQWGGRYILAPTTLLLALGVVALRDVPVPVRSLAVGASVAVTVVGVAWLSHRSHDVDRFFDELAARPEDVIVSTNGFLVREAGPAAGDRRYLSVSRRGDVEGAVAVAERAGAEDVGVLTLASKPPEVGAAPLDTEELELLGVPIFVHIYRLAG